MSRAWRLFPNDPQMGWVPYVWVLYLGFVFLVPVLGELEGPSLWWGSAAAAVAFLPLYVAGFWVTGWKQTAVVVCICAIGAALAPVNPGASTFFAYAAYFAGLGYDRLRDSLAAVGLVFALAVVTALALAPTVYFAAPAVLGVTLVGLLGANFARQRVQYAELRMARAEVEALARIAERDRIAGDLHDLLGHTLSLIAVKSELTQALAARDSKRAAAEAGEVRSIARKALDEVRTAVRGYRVGDGAGLRFELDGVRDALGSSGVELQIEGGLQRLALRLDATHEGVVALAVREAVTNVMRHADASRCWITFFDESGVYGVEIRDDGRGVGGRMGHGLIGMRRRVEALGGRLSLSSDTDGTRLRLEFDQPQSPKEDL